MQPNEVTFLRKHDYQYIRELGAGACGRTVLLRDPEIGEEFVCKKYAPASEAWRERLFGNFLKEIKVLHRIYHRNVVRIFNYYIYKDRYAGYILMEYVEGMDIHSFLTQHPEQAAAIFTQTISGFRHLEENRILHRDIRPPNIIVRNDGVAKIIDFGFGKEIGQVADFNRSISLNWWCEVPNEFSSGRYDFSTEVYFVGKLFESAIRDQGIENFPHLPILAKMCQKNPAARLPSFVDVDQAVSTTGLSPNDFTEEEIATYRLFSAEINVAVIKIEVKTQYEAEAAKIELELEQAYRSCLLEERVPDAALVLRCFLRGQFYYRKERLSVGVLKEFVSLLKSCTKAKKNIVVSNLQTKLGAKTRYSAGAKQDVPF